MSELSQRQMEENKAEFMHKWNTATFSDEDFARALKVLDRKVDACAACTQERQVQLAALRARYEAGERLQTLWYAMIDA